VPAPLRVHVIDHERLVREALALAIAVDPRFTCPAHDDAGDADVVVVGAHAPGSGIHEAIADLRRDRPRSRIVAVVSYLDDPVADSLLAAGADTATCASAPFRVLLDAVAGELPSDRHVVARHDRDERAAVTARADGLTSRQFEVLQLLGSGLTAQQVSRQLQIKLATTRDHIKALHRRMGCSSTTELVVVAARRGFLPQLQRPLPPMELTRA